MNFGLILMTSKYLFADLCFIKSKYRIRKLNNILLSNSMFNLGIIIIFNLITNLIYLSHKLHYL